MTRSERIREAILTTLVLAIFLTAFAGFWIATPSEMIP